jgi:hypothetical protein
MTLEPVPFTPVLEGSGHYNTDTTQWTWETIGKTTTIWTPSLEIGRQALAQFLDYWVENATETNAIFLIPQILQRDWGHLSKHIHKIGTFSPYSLPWSCRYNSLTPFCLLYCPRWSQLPLPIGFERWHQAQAELVRGL